MNDQRRAALALIAHAVSLRLTTMFDTPTSLGATLLASYWGGQGEWLTGAELGRRANVSEDTALRRLRSLYNAGRVHARRDGKGWSYRLTSEWAYRGIDALEDAARAAMPLLEREENKGLAK